MASSTSSEGKAKLRSTNPFLRSWAWKREHRPDRDRFDRPYIHQLLVSAQPQTLIINQARFSTRGFASTVWDSAIVLSKYLERWPQLVSGKQCIELGAGCGLPGITAACLGAASVLLTDLKENLSLLQQNAIANCVTSSVSVAALEWGFRSDVAKGTFEVILATDVMYEASIISAFLATVRGLCISSSRIFLAYGRNRQAEEQFFNEASKWFMLQKVGNDELDEVFQCIDVDVYALSPNSDCIENNL